ncbi:MAG: hypothetical protein LC730_03250 [Acidobacteria bacterium]|nr:hypothetical protein [Acidobacteriota bacterium]
MKNESGLLPTYLPVFGRSISSILARGGSNHCFLRVVVSIVERSTNNETLAVLGLADFDIGYQLLGG